MPKRKKNLATEREGVNYVRSIVEAHNSVFKEISQQHDYGHDAFILLVEEEQVLSKEVAVQIKAGVSYCTSTTCKIPATASQLAFWANHDLTTLGVVYDPVETVAYWVDLKAEARERVRPYNKISGGIIEFPKSAWNRFDFCMFPDFIVPTLQRKAPRIGLARALKWLASDDLDTHELGARILTHVHYIEREVWLTFFALFQDREPEQLSGWVGIAFSRMIGHPDDCSMHDAPKDLRAFVTEQVLRFGPDELAKLLCYVDEYGFERPSTGYGLLPVLAARSDSPSLLIEIRDNPSVKQRARENAALLYEIYADDPHWYGLWCKEK